MDQKYNKYKFMGKRYNVFKYIHIGYHFLLFLQIYYETIERALRENYKFSVV